MTNPSKHERVLNKKCDELKKDSGVLGFYLIGSMVKGTATENSDIDIEIIYSSRKNYELKDEFIDGIKIGLGLDSLNGFIEECENNPQNAYIVLNSKILYDPKRIIFKHIKKVKAFFKKNPKILQYWEENYTEYQKLKKATKSRKTYFDVIKELNEKIKNKEIKIV